MLAVSQDLSGGMPILIEGTDLPLWGMEIDTEREKERFKAWSAGEGGAAGGGRVPACC